MSSYGHLVRKVIVVIFCICNSDPHGIGKSTCPVVVFYLVRKVIVVIFCICNSDPHGIGKVNVSRCGLLFG